MGRKTGKHFFAFVCVVFVVVGALRESEVFAAAGKSQKYEATWESMKQYEVPQWYEDAKFGIFIHWGVYSVPAYRNEWYPREMYQKGHKSYDHHLQTYGHQSQFGYKDFIADFKAENWDPDAWARLFKKSGAKYVVPVAEHHDGFPMYDCSYTKWDSVEMGPRRDVLGELGAAIRRQGMKLGASSHRAKNWNYYFYDIDFDTSDPRYSGLYGKVHPHDEPASREFIEDWYARTVEIVDKYQPDLMWFDFGFEPPEFEPWRRKFAAYYYNKAEQWGTEVAINYKHNAFPSWAAVLDLERTKRRGIREQFWQTDTSVCWSSWGYIRNHKYKSVDSLVDELVDIVSKNGCMLLNIGPKSDGTIPQEQQSILLEIGKWLDVNGEAIYGTTFWRTYGEGSTQVAWREKKQKAFTAEDIRFTSKGDKLYAIVLDWPGEQLTIKTLGSKSQLCSQKIIDVTMLGVGEKPAYTRDEEGLKITMPAQRPCDHAYAFRVTLTN